MKTSLRVLISVMLALESTALAGNDTDSAVVLNEDVEVLHAERMAYPLPARVHPTEGAVVIKVLLDKDGRVRSAMAVAGPKLLISECIENAKKWQFRRTTSGIAIIVYLFQIRGLCELPCPSNFEFHPPNVVLVSMGRPIVMP